MRWVMEEADVTEAFMSDNLSFFLSSLSKLGPIADLCYTDAEFPQKVTPLSSLLSPISFLHISTLYHILCVSN